MFVAAGFLPGFLWQVGIKAKVAEFTHSPRNFGSGGRKVDRAPLQRKFWDFGCRIESFGVAKRSITRFLI